MEDDLEVLVCLGEKNSGGDIKIIISPPSVNIGEAARVLLLLLKQANNGGNYFFGLGCIEAYSLGFSPNPFLSDMS